MTLAHTEAYALVLDDDDSFDQIEAPGVLRDYVCAVCHQELEIYFITGHWRVMIACAEHGNVTSCGRVMRSTVNIQDERAHRLFKIVIRNLPDLWGSLVPKPTPLRSGETRQDANIRELGF